MSGILFLYKEVLRLEIGEVVVPPRACMPSRVPVVLTPGEVRGVIDVLTGVPRTVVMLLYGAGLRLQELPSRRTCSKAGQTFGPSRNSLGTPT